MSLVLPRRRFFLCAGVAAAGLGAPAAQAEEIDRRVARRYRHKTPGSPIDTGGAVITVHGSMDEVLRVVQDFRKYHRILPRLEQSRVVRKHKNTTDVYMRAPILRGVAHVWGIARFAPLSRYKGRGRTLAGRMVKGNLDGWHGAWRVYPCGPGRTVLRMEMFIDLQIPVPVSLVTPELEWAADKAVTAVRDMVECGHSTVKDD